MVCQGFCFFFYPSCFALLTLGSISCVLVKNDTSLLAYTSLHCTEMYKEKEIERERIKINGTYVVCNLIGTWTWNWQKRSKWGKEQTIWVWFSDHMSNKQNHINTFGHSINCNSSMFHVVFSSSSIYYLIQYIRGNF